MRCRQCEYRLWNLTSRTCPECGAGFRPSDYDFAPNSVQFHCPHCAQVYYGTGERGHLEPAEFDCVTCQRRIHMDDMVIVPAEGVNEEQTAGIVPLPWLNRQRVGWFGAWYRTVGLALAQPGHMMRRVELTAPWSSALGFHVVTMLMALVLVSGVFLVIPLLMFGMGMPAGAGAAMLAGFGIIIGVAFGVSLLFVGIWGLVAHGLLRLTGETRAGLGRTYQALLYSSGAHAVSAIPCLGIYVGWLWWLISSLFALREAQRVSAGRAALSALVFPLLALGGCMAFYFGMVFYSISGVGGWQGAMTLGDVTRVRDAVVAYARQHGAGPQHAFELVIDGPLSASDFIRHDTPTLDSGIDIGEITLAELELVSKEQAREQLQALTDAQPPDLVAHRAGDFVLTWHGFDPSNCDPRLWLLVSMPDPNDPAGVYYIANAGGTITPVAAGALGVQLNAQNLVRQSLGLPALPNPLHVSHERPGRPVPR